MLNLKLGNDITHLLICNLVDTDSLVGIDLEEVGKHLVDIAVLVGIVNNLVASGILGDIVEVVLDSLKQVVPGNLEGTNPEEDNILEVVPGSLVAFVVAFDNLGPEHILVVASSLAAINRLAVIRNRPCLVEPFLHLLEHLLMAYILSPIYKRIS